MSENETSQRCGQKYSTSGVVYRCKLTAGHGGGHMDFENSATWTRAGDLVEHASTAHVLLDAPRDPVSLQHDACGARLTWRNPAAVHDTYVCALGPHDFNTLHRAADGTQWRASDFPPTAPTDRGAVARSVVAGLGPRIDDMARLFRELRDELAGEGRSAELDAVDAVLAAAGIGARSVSAAARELVGQRDSHAEHAQNAENALSRIADLAQQAMTSGAEQPALPLYAAMRQIVAVVEEKNR